MVEKLTEEGIIAAVTELVTEMGKKPTHIGAGNGPDEAKIVQTVTLLAAGVLIDLRTVANAVAKLSTFEIDKVGDILRVGPVFTAEEAETIEALRSGKLEVIDGEELDILREDAAHYRKHPKDQDPTAATPVDADGWTRYYGAGQPEETTDKLVYWVRDDGDVFGPATANEMWWSNPASRIVKYRLDEPGNPG